MTWPRTVPTRPVTANPRRRYDTRIENLHLDERDVVTGWRDATCPAHGAGRAVLLQAGRWSMTCCGRVPMASPTVVLSSFGMTREVCP